MCDKNFGARIYDEFEIDMNYWWIELSGFRWTWYEWEEDKWGRGKGRKNRPNWSPNLVPGCNHTPRSIRWFVVVHGVVPVHLRTSHNIQTQFNLGINFENERRKIWIENEVLGFEIEVDDWLFDGGEKKKSGNKGGTQMIDAMFVIPCNYVRRRPTMRLKWQAGAEPGI